MSEMREWLDAQRFEPDIFRHIGADFLLSQASFRVQRDFRGYCREWIARSRASQLLRRKQR
jgi:hypothetical protein